jgi:hypothetical protein
MKSVSADVGFAAAVALFRGLAVLRGAAALLDLLASAETLLASTGEWVALCPMYGRKDEE